MRFRLVQKETFSWIPTGEVRLDEIRRDQRVHIVKSHKMYVVHLFYMCLEIHFKNSIILFLF